MLNICVVFSQLERETIQKRVQDAWYARCQRGFKMGGRAPYGFRTEPIIIDGIHTKKEKPTIPGWRGKSNAGIAVTL